MGYKSRILPIMDGQKIFDNNHNLIADFGTNQFYSVVPEKQAYHQLYLFPPDDGDYLTLTDQNDVAHIYQYWVSATPQEGAIHVTVGSLQGFIDAINASGFFIATNEFGILVAKMTSGGATGNGKPGVVVGTLGTYGNSDTSMGGADKTTFLALDLSAVNLDAAFSVRVDGQRIQFGNGYDMDIIGSISSPNGGVIDTSFIGDRLSAARIEERTTVNYFDSTGFHGSGAGLTDLSIPSSNYIIKTTTYAAVSGDKILCDTSGGSFTITLPASPSNGDNVTFVDAQGSFATHTLTVGRNSQLVAGAASDITASTNNQGFQLIFAGGGMGWQVLRFQ